MVKELCGIGTRKEKVFLPFLFFIFVLTFHCCPAIDFITQKQYIRNPQTVTSLGENFRLGFFKAGSNSTNLYVGIWYNKIPGQDVVWVANREKPLSDSSGRLTIADDGNLVVLDGKSNVVWTTNVSNIPANNSVAMLLDSGNLVLQEVQNDRRILWQSFEHPSDTLMPTMKVGASLRTGEKQLLTSWRGQSDPSPGSFSSGIDLINIPQIVIWNGSRRYWRSGPWNNRIFIGIPTMYSVYLDGFYLNRDAQEDTVSITFNYADRSFSKFVLNYRGQLSGRRWDEGGKKWFHFWIAPDNECDLYGKCGPFGSCSTLDSPICSCLKGFVPKFKEEWSKGNWSGGCMRKTSLLCERNNSIGSEGRTDGFVKLEMMKVPDFAFWSAPQNVKECEQECLLNCSCIAYSYDSGVGCMSWSGKLVDVQKFSIAGVDLYIRVAYSELDEKKREKRNANVVIIIIAVLLGTIAIGVCMYFSWRWTANREGKKKKGIFDLGNAKKGSSNSNMLDDNPELRVFSYQNLAIATNNFSIANKLGEGGFGSVYKGILPDGQELAVKRLSKSSGQGLEEFKNEVIVISKLQHRNLVRLLGCCIEAEEKMLTYEYMPNKSLDAFLFDESKRALLDWRKRFQIIEGIARGILYLHRDSRLRVIHRDLKASNVLLDEELNPKISDFGMARMFKGNDLEGNTRRVAGTYGYMSPEYAMQGQFSEKSDVFSFGVLLLEIVSGERNTSFYQYGQSLGLLGYAWELWNEDRMRFLIDPLLSEPRSDVEILRCIHVGLLCVQDLAKDRPTMSSIISMITSEIASLPTPRRPALTGLQVSSGSNSSLDIPKLPSVNYVTVSSLGAR